MGYWIFTILVLAIVFIAVEIDFRKSVKALNKEFLEESKRINQMEKDIRGL